MANANKEPPISHDILNKVKSLIQKRVDWENNERKASRKVQYAIIGETYEAYLGAKKDPIAYRKVARELGLKVSANMDTANLVAKIVFGTDEPGRLPGIAAVLRKAAEDELQPAEVPAWLEVSGGIQGVRSAKDDANPGSVSKKADDARTLLNSGVVKGVVVPDFGASDGVADETGFALAIVKVGPSNQVEIIHISSNKSALNAVLAEYAERHGQTIGTDDSPEDTLEVELRSMRKQSLDRAYEEALR
ncbi:hypothetical protein DEVEQU_01017 [Devosia equisanguinis]|uniref:Uncharacterized protein n=1 Tax=Devosia equisanguinis TaxID=2490941 RepID=A0A447I904_9HYPH|nr:hypothetical protein [Devosia equisanguinis]VDS03888.1 hypothetical protein DEVEQU_01017 [Devosia equisanguinis]